jgi:hypothetical protein
MREYPMRILNHLCKIQLFAMGSTVQYLDLLALPQIQVDFAPEYARM